MNRVAKFNFMKATHSANRKPTINSIKLIIMAAIKTLVVKVQLLRLTK
jgi:hypothetical protein